MEQTLTTIQEKLTKAEELFFTWLLRVIIAAILVGSAWIDDAPPLSMAAVAIAIYVAIRLLTQFKSFVRNAPFQKQTAKYLFGTATLSLLLMSFVIVTIFVDRIAESVVL